jgi:sodium/potassium-transporting ATPase subunit alpha
MWMKFANHLFGGFSCLLWIGSILCFTVVGIRPDDVENLTLGIVLAVVVTMTAIFAFYQDLKAEKVLEGFLKLTPSTCVVKRDNKFENIDATQCVIGDIVKIEGGKKIAADVVVLMSQGVKVDNSSLTGESEAQKRAPGATDEIAMRSRNVAFFGTNCEGGIGEGVVVRCGDDTAIGGIAAGTLLAESPDTLMKIELERFVHLISYIALGIGFTFLIISIAMNYDILDSIVFTIGIIVANVPEGLLATVTVALTITAMHMADKQVLVKNVQTVETLGAVTVIASDKTGTLTQNRMTVRHAVYGSGGKGIAAVSHGRERSTDNLIASNEDTAKATGSSDYEAGIFPVNKTSGKVARTPGDFNQLPADLQGLVRVAGLCNHAEFIENKSPILNRATNGDASESALLKFAHSHTNVDEMRESCKEIACVPFNSANKWMATIHREVNAAGSFKQYRLLVKGAPERVMERCGFYADGKKMTDAVKADVQEANNEVAENGERVLAFAETILKGFKDGFHFDTDDVKNLNFKCEDLTFVGLLSLEDPPRAEVPGAVQLCRDAGIRVIMVTGDQPLTARSIASQVGIISNISDSPIYNTAEAGRFCNSSGVVVTGSELDKFNEDDWEYVLTRTDVVFSRTLPHQKQQIVAKLQDGGLKVESKDGTTSEQKEHVVAVTGDGVNDAPALKKANVGIAMGIVGSEVAKDAADMILMDDNFASIVNGIEEGRLIFSNLKKSIAYTLTSNIPEILPFLCMITLRIPVALTTIMILCIDLGTDMLPAIAFAYENAESNIMKQPPRDRFKDKLVTWQLISFSYLQIGIIQALGSYTTFFWVMEHYGFTSSYLLSSEAMQKSDGLQFTEDNDYDDCIAGGGAYSTCCPANDDELYKYDTGSSSGQCASSEDRADYLSQAQTAFLATIVVCQIGCGLACKTRLNTILTQGMVNWVQNYGIFQEVTLIVMLVYVPFLNSAFGTSGFPGVAWLIGFPFAMCILGYDEFRKWVFREYGHTTEWSAWWHENFFF